MSNFTEIIADAFAETTYISYADCQEIVFHTTTVYRTQEQLYLLLFLIIGGILVIKWLWNK